MSTPNFTAIAPVDISFVEWASQIRVNLPDVSFPVPDKVENWRDWASQVVNNNSFNNLPFPTETVYPKNEDWQKWAAYFIENVYTQN